jgi:hypothetical protein
MTNEALPHPDALVAIAWLIALAIGTALSVRDALNHIKQKTLRANAKWRANRDHAAQRQRYQFGERDGSGKETKLPPIL